MLDRMGSPRRLLVIALATVLVGGGIAAGTFASFTASTTNASSTFATGSLVLSNKVNSATACLSTGSDTTIGNTATDTAEIGVNSGSCDAAFTALTANKPGDSATAAITLKNEGNVTGATGIRGVGTTCSSSDTPNTGGATATNYHGSGNICSYVTITVQEVQSNLTTAVKCLYPAGPGTCGAGDTVANFVSTTTGTPMSFNTASVAAGDLRYVVVTLAFPNGSAGAENNYMGRYLGFGMTWTLTQ
jgi:hypothetical protein